MRLTQGNTNKRIHISAGQHTLQNFQSIEHTISEIVQYGQDISKTSYDIAQKNELHQFIDIDSILEEMSDSNKSSTISFKFKIMPTYDFLNTKTGEEFSEFMSISEKETYLKHNSHIQQKVSSINIISGTGGIKNDGELKELQSKI